MRAWLIAVALLAAPAAPAHAATPVVLGSGPGGLLALDASGAAAYAVVGRPNAFRPLGIVRSNGRSAKTLGTFGAHKARDPDLAARPGGGVTVSWARAITGGMEYSLASLENGRLGQADVAASGTGPPRLTLVEGAPVLARPDTYGNVVVGEETLTEDGIEHRHHPLDATTAGAAALVLDVAQGPGATSLKVLGADAPAAPVLRLNRRRDLEGSIVADSTRIYVGFLNSGVAYYATALRRPDARWKVRRLPGPGAGQGAPAVARSGGFTFVAYAQGKPRRDIYLARVGARTTRLSHLTSHPDDDTRPRIAPAPNGRVFVGWTRERRNAEQGTALLLKTG